MPKLGLRITTNILEILGLLEEELVLFGGTLSSKSCLRRRLIMRLYQGRTSTH